MKTKVKTKTKKKKVDIEKNVNNSKKTNNQKSEKCNNKLNKQKSANNDKKKNMKLRRTITISVLSIIFIAIIILILLSDLFSIKVITVVDNLKICESDIISVSQLTIGDNMFKTLTKTIKDRVKTQPYIEDVKVKKKINGEIIITVKERTATYMLQCDNGYAYINNQGYILETSDVPLNLPIIKEYETENVIPGERLINSDLKKLDLLIQIMENAKSNGIAEKIYAVNISDNKNFILEIPSEGKTIQFGDETNINYKILRIVDTLERTKGISGEIVLNVPDIKKIYFTESV